MGKSKLTTIALSITTALFIVSGAISVPLLWRGFYYGQIEKLNLVKETGYSEEIIRDAYNQMMDYCMGGGENAGLEFGTGDLTWSEDGKAHFDDCIGLFKLDIFVLEVTAIILFGFILGRVFTRGEGLGKVSGMTGHLSNAAPGSLGEQRLWYLHPHRPLGRGPFFWGPVALIILFGVIAALASRNFDAFFTAFHRAFFPGKENWIFDPTKDEIIRILPETFFMNCAILIVAIIVVLSVISIIADFITGRGSR